MRKAVDVVVAGAGIMGLHAALQVKRRAPDLTVRLVEKARGLGQGSSGYRQVPWARQRWGEAKRRLLTHLPRAAHSSALLRCRYSTA